MTATLDSDAHRRLLEDRLASFREEHARAQSELVSAACGDDADRATNVDAHIRLAMLEDRIHGIERELDQQARAATRMAGVACVGDAVTVDLGDGPEQFVLASVDQAVDGVDVITPSSPLGRALLGIKPGTSIDYEVSGRSRSATLVALGWHID